MRIGIITLGCSFIVGFFWQSIHLVIPAIALVIILVGSIAPMAISFGFATLISRILFSRTEP